MDGNPDCGVHRPGQCRSTKTGGGTNDVVDE